jgi:hypothetical protein
MELRTSAAGRVGSAVHPLPAPSLPAMPIFILALSAFSGGASESLSQARPVTPVTTPGMAATDLVQPFPAGTQMFEQIQYREAARWATSSR